VSVLHLTGEVVCVCTAPYSWGRVCLYCTLQVRSCLSVLHLRKYRMDFDRMCSWGLCTSIFWKFYLFIFFVSNK